MRTLHYTSLKLTLALACAAPPGNGHVVGLPWNERPFCRVPTWTLTKPRASKLLGQAPSHQFNKSAIPTLVIV